VEIGAHVVVSGADAEFGGFLEQDLLLNQLLADLLLKEVEDHGIVSILRAALLELLAGNLLDANLADGVAGGEKAAVPVRVNDSKGVRRRGRG